jgi:hypothetical protein
VFLVELLGKNQVFYPSKTPFLLTFSVYCIVCFFKEDYARNRTDERLVGGDSILRKPKKVKVRKNIVEKMFGFGWRKC